jgi:hypothetical protein
MFGFLQMNDVSARYFLQRFWIKPTLPTLAASSIANTASTYSVINGVVLSNINRFITWATGDKWCLMKTLAIVAALAIALMFVVTSCSDRTRGDCITKPEAPRCDTSTGATTP